MKAKPPAKEGRNVTDPAPQDSRTAAGDCVSVTAGGLAFFASRADQWMVSGLAVSSWGTHNFPTDMHCSAYMYILDFTRNMTVEHFISVKVPYFSRKLGIHLIFSDFMAHSVLNKRKIQL
jgi:hypothetical protein